MPFKKENNQPKKDKTMKKIILNKDEVGDFITPRQCQGQMVTRSYTRTWEYIIERAEDHSSRKTTCTAYKFASKSQSPREDDSEFEANLLMYAPKLGRRVSEVTIQ